tara:strand:+ start:510 stop:818 length:309 start_codon:yes stop_codon:yes gene_type:complete
MKTKSNENFLEDLYAAIKKQAKGKDKKSYTKFLISKGRDKIAQKIAEESSELIIDYLKGSKKRVVEEASDLIYHLLVMLCSRKITLSDIKKELQRRKGVRRK